MKISSYLLLAAFTLFQLRGSAQTWVNLNTTGNYFNSSTNAVACDPAGNVYTGGNFVNDSSHTYVAKWDGSTWSELGGFNSMQGTGSIQSICSDLHGNIYAAGQIQDTLNHYFVPKYDGSSWSKLGGKSFNGIMNSICSDLAGNIYVAGAFLNDSNNFYVAKYDGTSWTELGGLNSLAANGGIDALCCDNAGNVYAAGNFTNGTSYLNGKHYVAKYNGSTWSELGGPNALGANNIILSICADAVGNIYAGGTFTNGNDSLYVAKYNGSTWSSLGGLNAVYYQSGHEILSVCADKSGYIYAGGFMEDMMGNYLAQYNGTGWTAIGRQFTDLIESMCQDGSGNLYVGGDFRLGTLDFYIDEYEGATGIKSINISSNINIAPNPSAGAITVSSSETLSDASIRVADLSGQTALERTNQSGKTFTLDISGLAAGMYFVKLRQGEMEGVVKVVKIN